MINISITDHVALVAFWVCFTHWLTILIQLPIFDSVSIPNNVKVLTSFVIAYAFYDFTYPSIAREIGLFEDNAFWVLTIYHALIGLLIGYMVKVIIHIFTMAGSLIAQQIGFGAMRYFDPTLHDQIGPIEKIIHSTVIVMLLLSGALIPMFKGVFQSFHTMSLTNLMSMSEMSQFFLYFFKSIFESALMLATPLLFTNLVLSMVMGVIARSIPQMNIIMVSFVVNIGVGLMVFTLISNEFFHVAFKMYTDKLGDWFNFVV